MTPPVADDVPADRLHYLTGPNFGMLGTVRPDNTPQVNPMWFEYEPDTRTVRFTHTNKRGKYRNLQSNPGMSLAVFDPDDPLNYLELRGTLTETVPDPTGAFYVRLQNRYGNPSQQPPANKADRVILVMSVTKVIAG